MRVVLPAFHPTMASIAPTPPHAPTASATISVDQPASGWLPDSTAAWQRPLLRT
jgi:hypothetical protein